MLSSGAGRYLRGVAGAWIVCLVVLQVLALGPLRDSFWGVHHLGFLPWPLRWASWVLSLAGLLVLVLPPAVFRAVSMRGERVLEFGTALGFAVLAWLCRSRHLLLGDGYPLSETLARGEFFHARFPVTKLLQIQWYRLVHPLFEGGGRTPVEVVVDSVALLHVLCGFLFALVAFGIGRSLRGLGRDPEDRTLGFLVAVLTLGQGYVLLYFGYIEHYTLFALAMAGFVWTALRCFAGRGLPVVPLVFFVLCLGLHVSGILLLPAVLVLSGWSFRNRKRNFLFRDVLIAVAAALLLDWGLGRMREGFGLLHAVSQVFAVAVREHGGGSGWEYWISGRHLRDFFNEQVLVGPVAGLPFLVFLAPWARDARRMGAPLLFLVVAAGTFLGAGWFTSEPTLGYARDWDIFAAPAVVSCVAAAALIVVPLAKAGARSVLLALVLASLAHSGPWVLLNHSEERSLQRFAHLPLGYGRTSVVIGNRYLRKGDLDEARRRFEQALAEYPGNNDAHQLLGVVLARKGDVKGALPHFQQAVSLRPDKPEYRATLARALRELGRNQEAIPHLEFLCERSPEDPDHWLGLVEVLEVSGRSSEDALAKGTAYYEEQHRRRPQDPGPLTGLGLLAVKQGDRERALARFEEALGLDPDFRRALLGAIYLMVEEGNLERAVALARRFLERYPDHPASEGLRGWLEPGRR